MPARPLSAIALALLTAASVARAQDSTAAPVRADTVARADSASPASTATKAARPKRAARPAPVWPVPGPAPLPGAILPAKRIVAFYGNPLSKRMGILGELPPDAMLAKLDEEVRAWEAADSTTPVQPALHLIAVVAQADAGADGKYRARMSDAQIEKVLAWAARRDAIVFLDVQPGLSTLKEELPRLEKWLKLPNVHLALDPEFAMRDGARPGTRVGRLDAADIDYATGLLAAIVERDSLPPKVLVVHRFTRPMLTNASKITLDPRVQVVIHMDGWGHPPAKRATYEAFIYREPVQFAGFKVFYKNDRKRNGRIMTPEEILQLHPRPVYIQYH